MNEFVENHVGLQGPDEAKGSVGCEAGPRRVDFSSSMLAVSQVVVGGGLYPGVRVLMPRGHHWQRMHQAGSLCIPPDVCGRTLVPDTGGVAFNHREAETALPARCTETSDSAAPARSRGSLCVRGRACWSMQAAGSPATDGAPRGPGRSKVKRFSDDSAVALEKRDGAEQVPVLHSVRCQLNMLLLAPPAVLQYPGPRAACASKMPTRARSMLGLNDHGAMVVRMSGVVATWCRVCKA
jgi:hypothetical protein